MTLNQNTDIVNDSSLSIEESKPVAKKTAKKSTAKTVKKAPAKKVAKKTAKPKQEKEVAPVTAPVESSEPVKKEKKQEESIEFRYCNRKDEEGNYYIDEYRRDGEFLYWWNGKYWEQMQNKDMEDRVLNWLELHNPWFFKKSVASSIRETATVRARKFDTEYSKQVLHAIHTDGAGEYQPIEIDMDEVAALPEVTDMIMSGDNNKKEEASYALSKHYSLPDFSIKAISDVVVKESDSKEIYIPGMDYWLKVNLETAKMIVVVPSKHIPIKYRLNVKFGKLGEYHPEEVPAYSKFKKFLDSSVPADEYQATLSEFAGYSLQPSCKGQRFLVLLGPGGNGKSVFIEIMTGLHNHVETVDLGKLSGFNSDLPGASLYTAYENKGSMDEEFVKALVGGDPVKIEAKGVDKYTTRLTGKLIAAMNKAPHINDLSMGIFRRLLFVPFEQSFDGSKQQIMDFAQVILEEERKIVLDWALLGLKRLVENNFQFTKGPDMTAKIDELKLKADKIRLFSEDLEIVFVPENTEDKRFLGYQPVPKDYIYNLYREWTEENGFQCGNTTAFWGNLGQIFPELGNPKYKDWKIKGKRVCRLKVMVNEESKK